MIGYYDNYVKGGFFSSDKLNVNILNEFKNDFEELVNLNIQNLNVKYMDIEESGIIAAFARETIQQVHKMYKQKEIGVSEEVARRIGPFPHLHAMQFDKSLTANGLQIDLLFSIDGHPQCFLDDKYDKNNNTGNLDIFDLIKNSDFKGALAGYFKDENGLNLKPTVYHKNNFDRFYKMELFSAFKSL